MQGLVNVDSSRFHEGRGAGKTTTPGGHIIVNRKNSYEKGKVMIDALLVSVLPYLCQSGSISIAHGGDMQWPCQAWHVNWRSHCRRGVGLGF